MNRRGAKSKPPKKPAPEVLARLSVNEQGALVFTGKNGTVTVIAAA